MMKRRVRVALALAAIAAPAVLYQGCTVVVPWPGGVVIDLGGRFPHLDGDGEDSFLDRLFGFDDDDD